MTINDFMQACKSILVTFKNSGMSDKDFGNIQFKLHDLETSSQFKHVEYGVQSVRESDGAVSLQAIRTGAPLTFASVIVNIQDVQKNKNLPDSAKVLVGACANVGAPVYNSTSKTVIVDYGECDDEMDESILDTPKDDLDPEIWEKNADDRYVLTGYAEAKVAKVAKWAIEKFGITDPTIHIIGSITSNSYADDSDVDIHFCSDEFKPDDVDQFNRDFRAAFEKDFAEITPDDAKIGTHPIEVYFQHNAFQDMMSVGCYDFLEKKWESGPELKGQGFDPMAEYYEEDMKYVGEMIDDIRKMILETYETATVILRSNDKVFKAKQFGVLQARLEKAWKLYQDIRKTRKIFSEPQSKEEALQKRSDRRWHIADSAFKLLDKFGYIMVLRTYSQLHEEMKDNDVECESCARKIVDAVKTNFQQNKMLGELGEAEEIVGMPGWKPYDLKRDIIGWLESRISDYELDIRIKDIAFHGSRVNGGYRPGSDLDVIVYYEGANSKEDHVWNMLNDGDPCTIDGIKCDFWPTRDEESGNIQDVLRSNAKLGEWESQQKYRIWVDDIRQCPAGYLPFKSVNEFIKWYEDGGKRNPEFYKQIVVLDLDHDAGDYQKDGGDYIRILDFLEFEGVPNLTVRLHSANPVGVKNMRNIIQRNRWTECFDIVTDNELTEAEVGEGLKDVIRAGAAAGIMAGAGLFGAPTASAAEHATSKPSITQQAVNSKVRPLKSSYRGLSVENLINLIATIIYNEAMIDFVRFGDDRCLTAIANVIDNRSGGDPELYARIVSKASQFYSYSHVKGGITDKTFVKYDPHDEGHMGPKQEKAWELSKQLAVKMLNGTVENVIGDCNMIANKRLDNAAAWKKWGQHCHFAIGSHTFGYEPDQDGYAKNNKVKPAITANTYVVKSGDSLWKIAVNNNTTVDKLMADNGLKDTKLKIGQKLKV